MTLQDQLEVLHTKAVNLNWYAFGAVALTVGAFLITDAFIWFLLSVPALWFFGLVSSIVIAGRSLRKWARTEDE